MSTTERTGERDRVPVPRDREDDYTPEAARRRREFLRERTGAELEHVGSYSFDPAILPGNVEHFTGVAQVPIGLAGPLLVDGEHAQGEFYVPLATAEGTLVASYNRGMKLLLRGGRREDDGARRPHAARAGVRLPERARGARRSASGSTSTSTRSGGGRVHDALRAAAGHRAVLGQPHPLHALQLHDRRRRGPEPHRQGDAGGVPRGSRRSTTASSSSSWSRTSRPTRRARRSTCCTRAASAWWPRRRSPTSCSGRS